MHRTSSTMTSCNLQTICNRNKSHPTRDVLGYQAHDKLSMHCTPVGCLTQWMVIYTHHHMLRQAPHWQVKTIWSDLLCPPARLRRLPVKPADTLHSIASAHTGASPGTLYCEEANFMPIHHAVQKPAACGCTRLLLPDIKPADTIWGRCCLELCDTSLAKRGSSSVQSAQKLLWPDWLRQRIACRGQVWHALACNCEAHKAKEAFGLIFQTVAPPVR